MIANEVGGQRLLRQCNWALALALMAVCLPARRARHFLLFTMSAISILAFVNTGALAAETDCIENGGETVCSGPLVTNWEYAEGASNFIDSRMCLALGGYWHLGTCVGRTYWREDNLVSTATTAVNGLYTGGCSASDSGWGFVGWTPWTTSSQTQSAPVYVNTNILVTDYRKVTFSCTDSNATPVVAPVYFVRNRRADECSKDSTARWVPFPTLSCARPVGNACPLGNPIEPDTGVKLQIERDLHFEDWSVTRTYLSRPSMHQYLAAQATDSFDGLWRDTFDIRLQLIAGSASTIAALSTPDGQIQYFRADGSAILNSTKQKATRLVALGAGYLVWNADHALQFDAAGKLINIQAATGKILSLRHADGSLGPAGQVARDRYGNSLNVPVPANLLLSVLSWTGRELRYDRDASGRVTRVSLDPGVPSLTYFYDGENPATNGTSNKPASNGALLSAVAFPDGFARTYSYNESAYTGAANLPQALTGISEYDATSRLIRRYATFTYNSAGYALSTEHTGGVDKFSFTYITPFGSTSITDPLGTQRTANFMKTAGILRPAGMSQPGGAGCAAATNAAAFDVATGSKLSQDDFDGGRICYQSDATRYFEIVRVEGLANTTLCASLMPTNASLPAGSRKKSTQWHPDWHLEAKVSEPGRITTSIYNGQPDPFAGNAVANCAPASALLPDGKPIAVLCKRVEQATTDTNGAAGFSAALQTGVPNRVTTWTYNQHGQVLIENGPRTDVNDTTAYVYYSDTHFTGVGAAAEGHTLGDLQTVTNAAGRVTQYTKYNRHGQVLESIDPNGVVTTNTYDLRQRLLSTTVGSAPNARTTSYQYDPVGQLKQVTLPDQSWIGYDYDDAHRQVAVYDHKGNRVDYVLDNAGNKTGENTRDPSGNLKRQLNRSIDALGRVQQTTGRP